jgi:hypothetical protein
LARHRVRALLRGILARFGHALADLPSIDGTRLHALIQDRRELDRWLEARFTPAQSHILYHVLMDMATLQFVTLTYDQALLFERDWYVDDHFY